MHALLLSVCIGSALNAALLNDASVDSMSRFRRHIDAAKWPASFAFDKLPPPRIERDGDGHVIVLRLDGMRLSPNDLDALVELVHLKELDLSYTNIKDDQIAKLAALRSLKFLRLNHTAIGDDGVGALSQLPSLSVLCLGGIRASQEAVKELKRAKPKLSLGYFWSDGK
jgi:hypothetical protein